MSIRPKPIDPAELLENMRAAMAVLHDPPAGLVTVPEAIEGVRDAWEALDGWLSKGGSRPEDWKP